MRFKLLGLAFLGLGLYLVIQGLVLAYSHHDNGVTAQVQCLAAIFLAITVRVLQAEQHHRMTNRAPVFRSSLPPLPDPDPASLDFEEVHR